MTAMHSNWLYKISQKPMALPVAPPSPWMNMGIERIDQRMDEETADKLKQQYPDIQYGGAGAAGIVFRTGPGKMAKVTSYEDEVINATQAFYNQYDWVVPILSEPERVQGSPRLWLIHMKELKPVPRNETMLVASLCDCFNPENFSPPSVEYYLEKFTGEIDTNRIIDVYSQMSKIYQKNKETLQLYDTHEYNFGIDPDDGKLKIWDLGY